MTSSGFLSPPKLFGRRFATNPVPSVLVALLVLVTAAVAAAVPRLLERQDTAALVNAEFGFHRAFNRSAGRIKLAWFLLHAARYLPPHIYAGDPQWGAIAVANRRELIAALRRRDVDTVVRLTNVQFTDGGQRLMARLDELGLWT